MIAEHEIELCGNPAAYEAEVHNHKLYACYEHLGWLYMRLGEMGVPQVVTLYSGTARCSVPVLNIKEGVKDG